MENTPGDLPENQPRPPGPELIAQPVNQKLCLKCGTLNVADAKFCMKCGQAIPGNSAPGKKFCHGCGTVNEAASLYCWKCGLKLADVTATGAPLQYGGFWIRLGASVIDWLILGVVISIITIPLMIPLATQMMEEMVTFDYYDYYDSFAFFEWYFNYMGTFLLIYLLEIIICCIYFTVGVGKWGTTIGKAACGLKVVRTDGSRVSYWRAFARYWATLLNAFTWGLTYLIIAFNSKKQGLHDMICDTLVVKK